MPAARARRAVPARRSSSRPTSTPTARRAARSGTSCARASSVVQQVGIDEAYLDVTAFERPMPRAARARRGDRAAHRAWSCRSASGRRGSSPRPSAARSSRGRSRRCRASRRASASPTARRASCRASGPKTAERLAALGAHTVGDLQRFDEEVLVERFGDNWGPLPEGARVVPRRLAGRRAAAPRSRARARRRSRPTSTTTHELEATLARLTAELCAHLQRKDVVGRNDRDQGAPRRLDDGHPRAHDRASARTTRRSSCPSSSSSFAPTRRRGRCGCSACAWRRSRSRPRRSRASQMALPV